MYNNNNNNNLFNNNMQCNAIHYLTMDRNIRGHDNITNTYIQRCMFAKQGETSHCNAMQCDAIHCLTMDRNIRGDKYAM